MSAPVYNFAYLDEQTKRVQESRRSAAATLQHHPTSIIGRVKAFFQRRGR